MKTLMQLLWLLLIVVAVAYIRLKRNQYYQKKDK
jgi:hypothetical protein